MDSSETIPPLIFRHFAVPEGTSSSMTEKEAYFTDCAGAGHTAPRCDCTSLETSRSLPFTVEDNAKSGESSDAGRVELRDPARGQGDPRG